jgi:hypothetical protein
MDAKARKVQVLTEDPHFPPINAIQTPPGPAAPCPTRHCNSRQDVIDLNFWSKAASCSIVLWTKNCQTDTLDTTVGTAVGQPPVPNRQAEEGVGGPDVQ